MWGLLRLTPIMCMYSDVNHGFTIYLQEVKDIGPQAMIRE